MTQREKLLTRLRRAKEADFDDIHNVLIGLGFEYRSVGSHFFYTNGEYIIDIVRRSGKPIKRVYMENFKDLLDRMGL